MSIKNLYSDVKSFRKNYIYAADRITRDSYDELLIDKWKHVEEGSGDWTEGIETL